MDVKTFAIKKAHMVGTLTVTEFPDRRFGGTYVVIGDHYGMIEIATDMKEAEERIHQVVGIPK